MRRIPVSVDDQRTSAKFEIPREYDGIRIDRIVFDILVTGRDAVLPEKSRAVVTEAIRRGALSVNGKTMLRSGYRARAGEVVEFLMKNPSGEEKCTETPDLTIVYEDESIVVVDKPAGLLVFEVGGETRSLCVAIQARYPHIYDTPSGEEWQVRGGIAHRLDRNTSGLVIAAKTKEAYEALKELFRSRTIEKTYRAVVFGRMKRDSGSIEAPIVPKRGTLRRMAHGGRLASGEEKAARTEYRVLERGTDKTIVEAHPLSGRTHQIRLHFASIGHPLLGDLLYGSKASKRASVGLSRHLLHAAKLRFTLFGKKYFIESPLPEGFRLNES